MGKKEEIKVSELVGQIKVSELVDHPPHPTYILQYPKMDWKCELHPNTHWHCEEGKQPNAFHRFMQRLCFGVKWTKVND